MSALTLYLRTLAQSRASGAATTETSYYPALSTLLDEVGATLRPAVRCVLTLRNQGAGLPDGGLFTADQLSEGDPTPGQLPARGAIEVKGQGADLERLAESEQVARYLARYGLVLVTTYRAFALVERDAAGRAHLVDRYELAPDEPSFWQGVTTRRRELVATHEPRFIEWLQRAMQHAAPLRTPADLAWFLASYAREALARLAGRQPRALHQLRETLEAALDGNYARAKGVTKAQEADG